MLVIVAGFYGLNFSSFCNLRFWVTPNYQE